jgi:hypothetical protein
MRTRSASNALRAILTFATLLVGTSTATSAAAYADPSPAQKLTAAGGYTDVLWHNPFNGIVSAWLLNGSGSVLARKDLDWRCDTPSGCANDWKLVGTGDFNSDGRTDVLWHNPYNGIVSAWLLNGSGSVLARKDLDWRCDTPSGCANDWKLVGTGDFNSDGYTDVLWHNPYNGIVSAWLLNGNGSVLARKDLDWRCDTPSGCAHDWKLVGSGNIG